MILDLAASEAELVALVEALEAERLTLREVLQVAIHGLHDLTVQHDHLREQHQRLIDEYRALRAQIMREAQAAA